jgi:3,4-dihydroxy 2-butanone 4-phosphate synthase/GTP cyclohydrolase II
MKNSDFLTVEEALTFIRKGIPLIVTDDENRENEGDIVIAAERITPEGINFMAAQGRGLICQAITPERARQLNLEQMSPDNTDSHCTAFTVSVDAAEGTTTGISAADRARTARVLINPETRPEDLRRPGHLFPLTAKPGGLLERQGHTEAAVALTSMAGLAPSGVICEVMADSGEMARMPELKKFAAKHGLGIITIETLVRHLREIERPESIIPTEFGPFRMICFPNQENPSQPHFALLPHYEDGGGPAPDSVPLVRIHSECLTGEVLFSRKCDCRQQLHRGMEMIHQQGGALVYLRQEGRGIGLTDKIRAYALQEKGLDTVDANLALGLPEDGRDYTAAADILRSLGITRLRLLTNNPRKIRGLKNNGIDVAERIPLVIRGNSDNAGYLKTKNDRCGHMLAAAGI